LVLNADESRLYVAYFEARRVDEVELPGNRVLRSFPMPGPPSGLALKGTQLFVTCAGPISQIHRLELKSGKVVSTALTGHTAISPQITPDGTTLAFCLRFQNDVVLWDLAKNRERKRIPVGREPISVACTADGKFLLVAHHLPAGAATAPLVAATIGVIDLEEQRMVAEEMLPNGSSLVREIRLSPDGKFAVVAHNLAHYQLPTTQLERGWMNTAALSFFSLTTQKLDFTCVLDEVDRGAANPWAVGWTPDGRRLLVTHAGTHEISRIDFPGLLEKVTRLRSASGWDPLLPAEDLSFLLGLRERLPLMGNGPRAMAIGQTTVCVASYFSDTLECLSPPSAAAASIVLAPNHEPVKVHLTGERLFNDATLAFQGWQSCASCHSEQGRVDGLNWDLLNDGMGNPKNSKSLLWSHRTPPAMSMGVRITAEAAVRAGIRHILFAVPNEANARPIDDWLKSLEPLPSPWLVKGKLSAEARRGGEIFRRASTGCASCHSPGLFTDLGMYDVGSGSAAGGASDSLSFDTPTLVELWRTGPYLHDGSAADLRAVLGSRNSGDHHGRTSQLSERELNDLIAYLLAL
jgi:mono/diheme cytochrome c family protein/DNA-binding beta-propeller fold protein YncE